MTDDNFQEYVPKYESSCENRKRKILMLLKNRLCSNKCIVASDDSNQSHGRYLSLTGNRNAKKVQRRLKVGWMDFDPLTDSYKQVKTASGGGTRQLKLDLLVTMAELLEIRYYSFLIENICEASLTSLHLISVT
ncbi:hypothetical protein ACJMK2_013910 [Sinanodonta woodiana]|uniref:Uncharacterized protein n=1 Tax=Sinanodonta woodiana TaxID=1069815 RepID=A0ABD3V293_SINWO